MRVRLQDWGTGIDRIAARVREMLHEMRGPNYFCSHGRPSWSPRVNMHETLSHVILSIDLAGIDLDELELRIHRGVLQIEGIRRRSIVPEGMPQAASIDDISVHMMEIDSGRFCRGVPLPAEVRSEDTSATYRNGLLWVVAPKCSLAERKRT